MTSTSWVMKSRSALIWFSCFCWASTNFRSMPLAAVSADFTDSVFAVRHPDSAPSWEKPTVMVSPPPPAAVSLPAASPPPQAVRPQRAATPNAATMERRVVLGDDMGSSSSVGADCGVGLSRL